MDILKSAKKCNHVINLYDVHKTYDNEFVKIFKFSLNVKKVMIIIIIVCAQVLNYNIQFFGKF